MNAIDHHILVVDDGSPDETGVLADKLASIHRAVEVLHRPRKEGLGRGLSRRLPASPGARRGTGGDDGCRLLARPLRRPRLLRAADRGDVVIGSRYIEGGRVVGWHIVRRVISRAGCTYARTVLGVPVRDLTGGFKCMRWPVIERFCADGSRPGGYSFQIEWTFQAVREGNRVLEVPIIFRDRRAGSSKMRARMVLKALWRVVVPRARPDPKGRW